MIRFIVKWLANKYMPLNNIIGSIEICYEIIHGLTP